ncbi:hypothetical protein GCM10027341_06540 [Spirosoma knui]
MEHNHQFRLFAQNSLGYVGICDGCKVVNVAFQNSLFCLALGQFDDFRELIHDRLAMKPFCTSHGKELLMVTPMPNYFILFSEADLTSLGELLQEAAPVLEAERILNLKSV